MNNEIYIKVVEGGYIASLPNLCGPNPTWDKKEKIFHTLPDLLSAIQEEVEEISKRV